MSGPIRRVLLPARTRMFHLLYNTEFSLQPDNENTKDEQLQSLIDTRNSIEYEVTQIQHTLEIIRSKEREWVRVLERQAPGHLRDEDEERHRQFYESDDGFLVVTEQADAKLATLGAMVIAANNAIRQLQQELAPVEPAVPAEQQPAPTPAGTTVQQPANAAAADLRQTNAPVTGT